MILFYYFNFLKYFNLNVNITKLNYNENIVNKLKSKKKKPIVANRDTINYGYFDG